MSIDCLKATTLPSRMGVIATGSWGPTPLSLPTAATNRRTSFAPAAISFRQSFSHSHSHSTFSIEERSKARLGRDKTELHLSPLWLPVLPRLLS
ncbi:hypothetical protein M413DRAFT_140636 [Hebeloma cylindrosporum]|uniref:Uncharacterized protein n=1 Tax=Hebeloma cylindrosporum TaxID=76867 RepID=A0A0C3CCC9_HEBCY|nr:hypothetical protein M413DRAFT_140636 [Hebeloma cylindrosporum h7]